MYKNFKKSLFLVGIMSLVNLTSSVFAMNSEEELYTRQKIVSRQLEEHQNLNLRNGTSDTFYHAIEKEEKFEPMGGFPSIVLNTDPHRELNKMANHAKHKWGVPIGTFIDPFGSQNLNTPYSYNSNPSFQYSSGYQQCSNSSNSYLQPTVSSGIVFNKRTCRYESKEYHDRNK